MDLRDTSQRKRQAVANSAQPKCEERPTCLCNAVPTRHITVKEINTVNERSNMLPDTRYLAKAVTIPGDRRGSDCGQTAHPHSVHPTGILGPAHLSDPDATHTDSMTRQYALTSCRSIKRGSSSIPSIVHPPQLTKVLPIQDRKRT